MKSLSVQVGLAIALLAAIVVFSALKGEPVKIVHPCAVGGVGGMAMWPLDQFRLLGAGDPGGMVERGFPHAPHLGRA